MVESEGRLRMKVPAIEWVRKSERLSFLRFVPVDSEIARVAVHLQGSFHSNPADRIIVATAITLGAPVVTKDGKILDYPSVETVW